MKTEFKYFKDGKLIIPSETEKETYEPILISTVENFKEVWPRVGDLLEVVEGPLISQKIYFCGVSLSLNINSPSFPELRYLCRRNFDYSNDCEVFIPVQGQSKKVWH